MPDMLLLCTDLDRTLMTGSSGIYFAKAAYETGMISRGRLARDLYENLRFRLRGSTDERADSVRKRVGEMISGVQVRAGLYFVVTSRCRGSSGVATGAPRYTSPSPITR